MQHEHRTRQWWTGPVPLAQPPVETAPIEVELVVLGCSEADDLERRRRSVWHRDGACPEPDACDARLKQVCRACGVERVLCTATRDEIAAMKRRGWTCGLACEEVAR